MITDKFRNIAAAEVRSLLSEGYRTIGSNRSNHCETYVLRHPNGNVMKVQLLSCAVRLIKNNLIIKETTK